MILSYNREISSTIYLMDRRELAWAAGFFDGEGCVTFGKQGSLTLSISQTHPEVLVRFREAVGAGVVRGPWHQPSKPNANTLYGYVCTSFEPCQHVYAQLWPFLSSVKKQQIIDTVTRWKARPRPRKRRAATPMLSNRRDQWNSLLRSPVESPHSVSEPQSSSVPLRTS